VVLASELLAIRMLIPFVGSGTEVIAIVISAVLLPLAIGYHWGGQRYQQALLKKTGHASIRKILLRNIISAMIPLSFGLSYVVQELFFMSLQSIGITNHILQTALFCLLVLVYPVLLLAQTIPLLSNYFSKRHLSAITGKMLFFSTLGSFGGSVFSTLVLMTTIGVHNTVIVTLGLLVVIVLLLARHWYAFDNVMMLFFWGIVIGLNSPAMLDSMHIVANNQYGMTKIYDEPEHNRTIMDVNRSRSSAYSADPTQRFEYLKFIETNFLNPAIVKNRQLRILVLGAGGFTIGVDDTVNHYTYVDIDASLKETSEKHLLPEPLGKNKVFEPLSARAFLTRDTGEYDLIILDAYTSVRAVPMEVTTREFFVACREKLAKNGILLSNVISAPDFGNRFTLRYYNTFQSVFPYFNVQTVHPLEDVWSGEPMRDNIMYIYYHRHQALHDDRTIYTDDLNTYSLDR